ncbi:unnamed protein product [Rotaria socialis]|uniref:Uncharacterized protein n=1 Tax=Rotaria socialis TaxID=392032 RepID=A0A820LW08_9BILA|nr:unnamed protein product [Rotaria socialis]CAF4363866.1 unnamed protein product [Rotaria socialis]
MGCGVLFTPYTQQDIDNEIAAFTPRLPVAVLMNGGIIKLQGANGFFNPNSLLDPSWLRGKMTPQQYYEAIDYINKCTGYTSIGMNRGYSPSEIPMRQQLRVQAGMAAVEKVNEKNPSVHFTYQQTAESIEMDTSWSTDPGMRYINRRRAPIGHSSVTDLYITFN